MEFWLPLILIGVGVIVMIAIGVFLRRRRAAASEEPPEIGSPTDYTSLPIEEPTGWRDRFNNLSVAGKVLLVLVPLLVIVGGVVLVLALSTPANQQAVIPPEPEPEISIVNSGLVNADTILIRAKTTLPQDTAVKATLLANNEPFEWFDSAEATARVSSGEIEMRLARAENAPIATREMSFTVVLEADYAGRQVQGVRPLQVPDLYARTFYEQPVEPTAEPVIEPTAEPSPEVTPALEATPAPEVTPLLGSVFNGGNVRDTPQVNGSTVLDQINAFEPVQLLQRSADGNWYLIKNLRNNVGWVSATLLTPPTPEITAQIPVQGQADPLPAVESLEAAATPAEPVATAQTTTVAPPPEPSGLTASVFNGGNVRDRPQLAGSSVLDQINAGETVQLVQKTGDGQWYQIRNTSGTLGWVNYTLLTVDPTVAAKVPVAP